MITLKNQPTRTHAFFGAALSVLVVTAALLAWQAISSIREPKQITTTTLNSKGQGAAEAADPNRSQLTAAAALATGKPTLFYFYPADICSMRYCRQPEMIASELARLGIEINIVQITAHAIPMDTGNGEDPQLPFENWDLYPVAPYSEWLPELTETSFGLGLVRPEMALVDGSGNLLGQFDEFTNFDALNTYLEQATIAN